MMLGAGENYDEARSWLADLLASARLYHTTKEYKELLEFVVRLPRFAPFNAMLLQIQRPGLAYAASEHDWRELGRVPKPGARPLLILWPFGPVALVYDEIDTTGKELPKDVRSFQARGPVGEPEMKNFRKRLIRKRVEWHYVDTGDRSAGSISRLGLGSAAPPAYQLRLNQNHPTAVQFNTLAHELGHLFLGHLGPDEKFAAPDRRGLGEAQEELEAESVAYIVCKRNQVEPRSETYLASFVDGAAVDGVVDVYRVMHAAGRVEEVLGLATPSGWDRPPGKRRKRQRR